MQFWKKKDPGPDAQAVQTRGNEAPFRELDRQMLLGAGEYRLYTALRQAVPMIAAALEKIERLVGTFEVKCESPQAQRELKYFLKNVKVNASQQGIQSFLNLYLDQLLTFGTAVGEIVPYAGGGGIAALYNANLSDLEIEPASSPLEMKICRRDAAGKSAPVEYPGLILFSSLNPDAGKIQGNSLLKGLPFVSDILLKIYNTLGVNWERVGNVRFAVTYKPAGETDQAYAKDRAQQIAAEWGKAMSSGGPVSDFVAVGDVGVKVIGADNQILNSEIPVRQMLEQIVAKLGVPPFLLGLSWSSTERMSSQQADLLTSELEFYRRQLDPAVEKICGLWLRINGFSPACEICWNNISLQDEVDLAQARLNNAQAAQIEQTLRDEEG